MPAKFFRKLFSSIRKWIDTRHVEIPDGYGDTSVPIEHFNDEMNDVDHGRASQLSDSPHARKSHPAEC